MDDQSVDQLTAQLAHDLRGALSVLAINVDFALCELRDTAGGGGEVGEALIDCRAAGARLARTVSNFVDTVRGARGALAPSVGPVEASEVLAALVERCAPHADRVGVTLECATSTASIAADRDLLVRALEDVACTLVDLAQSGGRVSVSVEQTEVEMALLVRWERAKRSFATTAPPPPSVASPADPPPAPRPPATWKNGLALRFCRYAVEAQGASMSVEDDGVRLCFALSQHGRAAA